MMNNTASTDDEITGKGSYATLLQAQQQLDNIEAIDYFLAKQLVAVFQQTDNSLLFHLLMALTSSLRQGHTCLPLATIAETSFWSRGGNNDGILSKPGFEFPTFEQLNALFEQIHCTTDDMQPIVYWQQCLYLRRYFSFEQQLADFIQVRLIADKSIEQSLLKACITEIFARPNKVNSTTQNQLDWQMISVANALNKKFSVVAGGPGTGKTYTVTKMLAAIILLSQKQQVKAPRIAMVAPTGKAAQRLSESINNTVQLLSGEIADSVLNVIPKQAQTIHRLLGVIPHSLQFRHHQKNKLAVDVLLIDEVSMVDLALMTRIFRALEDYCQVILLGDADQLPAVLSGCVLSDLAQQPHRGYSKENTAYLTQLTAQQGITAFQCEDKHSHADHLTFLLKSHRFDATGGIAQLAAAVINSKAEKSWQLLNQATVEKLSSTQPLCLLSTQSYSGLTALVKKYYLPLFQCTRVSEAFGYLNRFRVLCATRQGNAGVSYLNELVKAELTEQGVETKESFYHGQPIMINENNYALGLYNGDVGLIWRDKTGCLMAVFENTENKVEGDETQTPYRWIIPSRLPNNEPVYAMTIHKTQGSEFEHVLMVLPEQLDSQFLSRELLYTGITRAKSLLSVISKKNVWLQAVEKRVQRYSNLALRLQPRFNKIYPQQ